MNASSLHVAIIMDGSGRWAVQRGLPRTAGHQAGADAVRCVVRAARECGVGTLTLFAFSSANWARPEAEVVTLMRIFESFLRAERQAFSDDGVRVSVIGRRDHLSVGLRDAIEAVERDRPGSALLHLRLAIDYSARDAILEAAERLRSSRFVGEEEFARAYAEATHAPEAAPAVDLLIRTGGEQRLSDCLLWEGAFAELWFTPTLWPDFGAMDLEAALRDFERRQRRFGRVEELVAS
jgi:undecaprenyl diphosphate synthase